MRCLTMRALLFSLTTLIGIYEGILFFKFDTLSPCAALSVQVSRIHEQARSELGLPIGVAVLLRAGAFKLLQQRERQALGIPAPDTPLHCAFALGKITTNYQGSVEMAKTMWRPEKELQAQSEGGQ